MTTGKLSQPYALRIEILRAYGITDQELIDAFKEGDISRFQALAEGKVDFTPLLEFSRDNWEEFVQAVQHGYEIKFSTFNGIKNFLSCKFGQEAERDYVDTGESLEKLKLKDKDVAWLRSVLSKNWSVMQEEDPSGAETKTVKIALR